MEKAQFAIRALPNVPFFYARWKQVYIVAPSGDHVFLWPAITQKEQGWPEPDQGQESFIAWCIAQVSSCKPPQASLVLSHGSQGRAQHTLLTLVLRRQIFSAAADWRQKSREKKIKGLQKTGQALYMFALCMFAFGWESLSPTEVPRRCSPSCLIASTYPRKTDYRHFSLLPHSVSSIIPSTHTGKQVGHSLAQRHLLFSLLSGHNNGGSETRRILEYYFAVC